MRDPKNTDAPAGKRARAKNNPPAAPLSDDEQRSLSVGIAAMMGFAAALSAPTLYGLARLIGFGPQLAWLLPAALDGYAVTSIWFGRRVPARHPAAKAARRNARLALALTVACNGLFHLLTLGGVLIPVGARVALLVAVSSLPPFLVDRLLHLRGLAAGNGAATATATGNNPKPATQTAPPGNTAPPTVPVADGKATAATATKQTTPPATPRSPAATGNTAVRLLTAAEKDRIVAALLDKHGDDCNLTALAEAIGTKHRATAMKVRDRVIKARTEPKPGAADAGEEAPEEPEMALGGVA